MLQLKFTGKFPYNSEYSWKFQKKSFQKLHLTGFLWGLASFEIILSYVESDALNSFFFFFLYNWTSAIFRMFLHKLFCIKCVPYYLFIFYFFLTVRWFSCCRVDKMSQSRSVSVAIGETDSGKTPVKVFGLTLTHLPPTLKFLVLAGAVLFFFLIYGYFLVSIYVNTRETNLFAVVW